MSSYCQADLSVNPDVSNVYVGPAKTRPPEPDLPGCQVVMYNGYTDFKIPSHFQTRENPTRGDRTAITKFSARSRKNLLKKLFSLSKYPSLFITLTYPYFFPADSSEWKRHLDNFRHRLLEKFPNTWFFWKLEPQKRGAPHYHLIGDLGEEVNIFALRRMVAWMWFDVCGTNDPKHLRAGTGVDIIRDSKRKTQAYVCKYIGKVDHTEYAGWEHPGRFWGIIGRENLPESIAISITMDKAEYFVIRRLVRCWLRNQSDKCRAYAKRLARIPSFFILVPREVIDRFLDLVLGPVPFMV